MSQWFIRVVSRTQPQNKLQEAIDQFLGEHINHQLTDDRVDTCDEIRLGIRRLNSAYPRCKPIEMDAFDLSELDVRGHLRIAGSEDVNNVGDMAWREINFIHVRGEL